ncbi:ROK family protein [Glutamicibacter sp.]|uniref:ROK family protein n=1 Tax=Glutamicibacter sp. TaxID=1931995 RepID=UPI002FE2A15A
MQDNLRGTGEVLALDIGGTKIAGALVRADGSIPARAQRPTPATAGSKAMISAMLDVISEILDSGTFSPEGLGLGSAGVIDPSTAKVLSATDTILGWAGTDLAAELGARTGLPVRAVNDVHAHGLGEARFGAGVGSSDMLLIAVGTGIGGAYLHQGQLVSGSHHVAGHTGHIDSVYAFGLPCSCGRTAHVEAIGSGPAIYRHYQRLANNPTVKNTREVAQLAQAGDEHAHTALSVGGMAVGSAAASLANVLDPQTLVLAGGMAEAGPLWWESVRAGFVASAIDALAHTPLLPATLGTDAALLGAASLFWNEDFEENVDVA